jgi:simple sugar transport system permease protein
VRSILKTLARSTFLRETGITLLSILLAFGVGCIILWIGGFSIPAVFANLWKGAFGSKIAIGQTLTKATPIILTSLSFLVAFRCGLFNIGAEGQMYCGAIVAAAVGAHLRLPIVLHSIVAVAAGGLAGAFWGWIPGYLKAKRGVNEFVTTMMLTYVAIGLTDYLVAPRGPLHDEAAWANQTMAVLTTARYARILRPTQVSWAIIVACIAVVVVWYFLFRTSSGYELRTVGQSPTAAEYGGVRVRRKLILALSLAGLLAGIAGAGEVLGTHFRFVDGFSPGYGWDGIAGGLIARAHPVGAIFAALLMGALRAGGMQVQRSGAAPGDIAAVLQGLVIFFIIAPTLVRSLLRWRRRRKE